MALSHCLPPITIAAYLSHKTSKVLVQAWLTSWQDPIGVHCSAYLI